MSDFEPFTAEIKRGTAIQDLIARVEKLEQFKTRLEAPMIQIQHLLMRVEELEEKFTAHCSVLQGGAKTICDLMDRVKELETNPPERTREGRETFKVTPEEIAEYEADLVREAVLAERERCVNRIEAAGDVYEESLYEQGWNQACRELASVLRSGE